MSKSCALVFLSVSVGILAQIICKGPCPRVEMMENFTVSRFAGRWYMIAQTLEKTAVDRIKCITYDMYLDQYGTLSMFYSYIEGSTGYFEGKIATVHFDDPARPSKMTFRFAGIKETLKMQILATDYSSYAVLFSCFNKKETHSETVLIWTRRRKLTQYTVTEIIKVIKNQRINEWTILGVEQNDCGVLLAHLDQSIN